MNDSYLLGSNTLSIQGMSNCSHHWGSRLRWGVDLNWPQPNSTQPDRRCSAAQLAASVFRWKWNLFGGGCHKNANLVGRYVCMYIHVCNCCRAWQPPQILPLPTQPAPAWDPAPSIQVPVCSIQHSASRIQNRQLSRGFNNRSWLSCRSFY